MKKLLFLILVLALASCTAAPTQTPVQPVAQEPIVVTVVVQPTQAPQQPEPIVVTVVVPATPVPEQPTAVPPPTQAQAPTAAPSTDTSGAPIVVDDILGKGVFSSITLSGNEFSLQCLPRELTITATAAIVDIKEAELFYRMVDQPKALYYSEWQSAGKMKAEGNGVFSFLLTGETVHPNLRLDPGWFEFQLVGLNKGGSVVDRTQKIEQLVTYRIKCP